MLEFVTVDLVAVWKCHVHSFSIDVIHGICNNNSYTQPSLGHQLAPSSRRNLLILGQNIRHGPNRRDAERINLLMALCIMELYMLELGSLMERRDIPEDGPKPAMNRRVSGADIAEIALEVLDVDGVEADDGSVEPDIGFCDGIPEVELVAFGLGRGEMGLDFVERGEEGGHGALVGLLCRRKAGFVHPVIDGVVGPFVGGFDVGAERRGVEVCVFVSRGESVVEGVVEHADDFGALQADSVASASALGVLFGQSHLVADDRLRLLVIQRRDREAALVLRVDGEVDIAQMREIRVEGVRRDVVAGEVLVGGCEAPSCTHESEPLPACLPMEYQVGHTLLTHMPMHRSKRDGILQSLELPCDQGAMRWPCIRIFASNQAI